MNSSLLVGILAWYGGWGLGIIGAVTIKAAGFLIFLKEGLWPDWTLRMFVAEPFIDAYLGWNQIVSSLWSLDLAAAVALLGFAVGTVGLLVALATAGRDN